MKIYFILLAFFITSFTQAKAIECTVMDNSISVKMAVPHPKHALIHRPDGTTVWLQSSKDFLHKQISDFDKLEKWIITPTSTGTVWIDGKAKVQSIITDNGKYHLYIAENTETEPENTSYIECFFIIGTKAIKSKTD